MYDFPAYFYSRKGGEKLYTCQIKHTKCQGNSCPAWITLEQYCNEFCKERKTCIIKECGDGVCISGQPRYMFWAFGLCAEFMFFKKKRARAQKLLLRKKQKTKMFK